MDVVFRLQDLGDSGAVDVLSELTERVPAYLGEPEATTLANNATWALFKIGGEAAREALERVRGSNEDEDRRELSDDLLGECRTADVDRHSAEREGVATLKFKP